MKKRTVEKIGLLLVITAIVGMYLLLTGCESGFSTSGADRVPLESNAQQAVANINARGEGWLLGVEAVTQEDRDPPHPANFAVVDCPGTIIMFRTTFGWPVERFESLIIHEAYEIQHGCKDNDRVANAFARCYLEGRTYDQCLTEGRSSFG